ncbi:OLC1v1010210C1 [Oldenlandia corymbosa var. corymbosa]|uniref:OLC1v1010210C1 n=1 Tax=Oldenlandia corymbosa var. corymbosa TaxID=529605 RepID=A0AAV1DU41_OLDCO|nr:OLC1v1010210C1 [Oldenlandia corymbosa var. corymbosa]
MKKRELASASPEEQEFPAPGKRQSKYGYPWLVYLREELVLHQTFYDIWSRKKDFSFHAIPELDCRTVLYCSPNGDRLILVDRPAIGSPRYWLWSPRSKEKAIRLPLLRPHRQDYHRIQEKASRLPLLRPHRQDYDRIQQALLSSTSSLVLLFVQDFPLILYCRVGDKKWSEFNYSSTIEAQTGTPLPPNYCLRCPVDFNGTIYATASCCRDLVQITVDDNNNCEALLLMPQLNRARHLRKRSQQSFKSKWRNFLVSLGGHNLGLILMSPKSYRIYKESLSVLVFKFDFSSMSWQQITSLNGGAVFLCQDYCLYSSQSGASATSEIGGSPKAWSYVYFSFRPDPTLFSYRIEDEKVTSYSLCRPNPLETWIAQWLLPAIPVDDQKIITTTADPSNHHDQQQQGARDCTEAVGEISYSWKNWKSYRRRSATTKRMRLMIRNDRSVTVPNDDGNPSLCDLSEEVLILIAQNLCFVDYMQFRCVNKLCASSTIGTRLNPFPPCLIYKDKHRGVYNILDYNLNQKLCIKIPEVLKDYVIRCSRNGWLLLEYNKDLALFNPLTLQVLPAGPSPRRVGRILTYTFLRKPFSSDCTILAISCHGMGGVSYSVRSISEPDSKWQSFVVGEEGLERFINKGFHIGSPVVLGEFCYHLGKRGRILLTQNVDSLFQCQVFDDLVYPELTFGQQYLTECGGELISVQLDGKISQRKRPCVRVFKLKDHKEWEEIDTLEGYCLYVSRTTSMSCLAERADMADRVYFSQFFQDDLVYYSLRAKEYHSVGSPSKLLNYNQTSIVLDCAWIKPSWTRIPAKVYTWS